MTQRLDDPRMRELGERLVFFEKPELLPAAVRARYASWAAGRIFSDDPNVLWTTMPKALRQADALLMNATREDAAFLQDVEAFLKKLATRHSR